MYTHIEEELTVLELLFQVTLLGYQVSMGILHGFKTLFQLLDLLLGSNMAFMVLQVGK
jgi:hypothetical protein